MKRSYSALTDFVNMAVKSRKYQESTAQGLRAALRLFDKELSEEERSSVETFKSRLEPIYKSVFAHNNKDYSADSLETYKKRVNKVLADYENYGEDPSKFAAWDGTMRSISNAGKKKEKKNEKESKKTDANSSSDEVQPEPMPANMQKIELPLRVGAKVVVFLPADVTSKDLEKIGTLLSLVEVKE